MNEKTEAQRPPTPQEILRSLRYSISELAERVKDSKQYRSEGEFIANVTLAYRHLEDAHQRLSKAISVFDV